MQSDDHDNDEIDDGTLGAAEEERMIRIMQYCDGTLSAREAALVADEIARDPEAARLAAELSSGAEMARSAWGDVDSSPVPFALARRVTQSARQPVRSRTRFNLDWRVAASFAAGIALGMLGLLLSQHDDAGLRLAGVDRSTNTTSSAQSSDPSWQPALMTALAKDPEKTQIAFGGASGTENAVRVARWFDTATGLHCAEFAKTMGDHPATGGIACKKPDGGWDVIEQQE